MNALFRGTSSMLRTKQTKVVDYYFGLKQCQTYLLQEQRYSELEQLNAFEFVHLDHTAVDALDKAYARALGNLERGNIDLADFYRFKHKLMDLKKTRFAEDYDGYKVVSTVGGTKARELHKLQAQLDWNERGEIAHKLWKERKEIDPAAKGPVGYI